MNATTDSRQKAIELIQQLPNERLNQAIAFLEYLSKPAPETSPLSEEAALLEIVQRRLPTEQQKKLDNLRDTATPRCRDRNEWGELTEAEYQELLTYEDLVERLEALIKLAKLVNTDIATLNRHLKSESQLFHATRSRSSYSWSSSTRGRSIILE